MGTIRARAIASGLIWLVLLTGGCSKNHLSLEGQPYSFRILAKTKFPDFQDDGDKVELREAIRHSIEFYNKLPLDHRVSFGEFSVRVGELKQSLRLFLWLLNKGSLDRDHIARFFDVFQPVPSYDGCDLVITGYYEPVVKACLTSNSIYRYPIYRVPDDLVQVDLTRFHLQCPSKRLVGRVAGNHLLPYYSRYEIDTQNKLSGKGYELAWLKDPVDVFLLHLQGSGVLDLGGGTLKRVGYAASNGYPYQSIGELLNRQGVRDQSIVSLNALCSYLRKHPDQAREILLSNKRYVFFKWVSKGPLGSLHVPLTRERSVAADLSVYPEGALAFLETTWPELDDRGNLVSWKPFRRWVLIQDSGAALKGTNRLDLFCGTGTEAGWTAGRMSQKGNVYLLIVKRSFITSQMRE